jgi:hypothetical protein
MLVFCDSIELRYEAGFDYGVDSKLLLLLFLDMVSANEGVG